MKINPLYTLRIFLTGFAMGTADLIPGVSGGTIAFLAGIYETLIQAIKDLSGKVLKLFLKGKFKEAFCAIPFTFLIPLGIGLLGAVFTLSKILSYLLNEQPIYIWSFFFGLVLASTVIVLKRITTWDSSLVLAFAISTTATFFLVGMIPVETPNTLPIVFLSGMIAICAMILPGISGSFILLLLGKYQQILEAVNNKDILTLGVFVSGCAIGIALFARVLSWLLKHYHNITIAILAGIMFGSIRKIWPWKEVLETRVNSHGEIVPLVTRNILPNGFTSEVTSAISLMVIGAVVIVIFEILSSKDKKVEK